MGIVELDETYVGGKPRKGKGHNKRGRGTKKAPVVGAVERNGNVTAKAADKHKLKGKNLRAFVKDSVDTAKAALIADEYKGVQGSATCGYQASGLVCEWGHSYQHYRRFLGIAEERDVWTVSQRQRNSDPYAAFDLTVSRGLGIAI